MGQRGKRYLWCAGAATTVLAAALSSGAASATTVVRMDLREITERSNAIVRARVASVRSEYSDEKRTILTVIEVDEQEVLKGVPAPGGRRVLRMIGGAVGEAVLHVEGQPTFEVGAEALLFLGPEDFLWSPVVGWRQGIWDLRGDGAEARAVSQADPAASHPVPELMDEVRTVLRSVDYVERRQESIPGSFVPAVAKEDLE